MHSLFSPSQLARIIACPSSVQLYKELDTGISLSSAYAEEGTLLHSYMERAVGNNALPNISDAEHRAICKDALDYVNQFITPTTMPFLETRVQIEAIPEVYGIVDVALVDNTRNTIRIMDYKFGAHIPVHAENNPQFMAYALGAIDTLDVSTTHRIFIHVIQPRRGNYEEIEVSYDSLVQWRERVLIPAMAKAKSDKPYFGPSDEACRWCLVKARCPARKKRAQEAASQVFAAYNAVKENKAISQDELVQFYEASATLKEQIKAVEEYVLATLLAGKTIPGYKVVRTRGRRKLTDEALAARYLFEHYDVDPEDVYETTMKSPAKLEKLCKGLASDPEFMKFVEMSEGNPTVVPESDKRPSINPFAGFPVEKI